MTWHCDEHGEVIPQATGTSYRCPCCTARVVWRDVEPSIWADGCKCTFAQRMVGDGCDVCNPELAAEMRGEGEE